MEKNDRPGDFEWAAKEFANVRKMRSKTGNNAILPFDSETREFMGRFTFDAEAPKPTDAPERRGNLGNKG